MRPAWGGGVAVGLALVAAALALIAIPALGWSSSAPSRSRAAQAQVLVYPLAGSRLATPETQITFRGVPADQLGTITVTGSQSGPHPGKIEADSDGQGGSFLPNQPFQPDEVVT